jgi:hypothetical protein
MGTNTDNKPEEEPEEETGDPAFNTWSDEGTQRFNECLNEGSAYISAGAHLSKDLEAYLEDEQREYVDPEFYDPDEETLPPDEMELIFENFYVM